MAENDREVRMQGPGGSVFKLALGFSGLELSLNGDEVGVVGPLLCQQFAQSILARWPMGAAAVTASPIYGRGTSTQASGSNGQPSMGMVGGGGGGFLRPGCKESTQASGSNGQPSMGMLRGGGGGGGFLRPGCKEHAGWRSDCERCAEAAAVPAGVSLTSTGGAGTVPARTLVRVRARHDEKIVWEAFVPVGYPLPAEGELFDVGTVHYAVRSRRWVTSGLGDIDMTVDLQLEYLLKSARTPRHWHTARCATLHGETCDCGAG